VRLGNAYNSSDMGWNFTPGRVLMLCVWSFLLGCWITELFVRLESGVGGGWTSIVLGIVVAVGGVAHGLSFSRQH
jgi:hypothetical protein